MNNTNTTIEIAPVLPAAWAEFRPHELQDQLWRDKRRFVVAACGRGSGKTAMALRRLALRCRLPGTMHFYCGPTVAQAKRIAWDQLLSLIPPAWIASTNVSSLTIKTVFDSEIHVLGMDKPHRIEGTQWDGGVVDECADQKPGSFAKSIFPALTHKRGWCWRIGVPKRTGVGAKEFKRAFDDGMSGQYPEIGAYTWASDTILPPDIIAEAQELLDAKDYNEQFNANWENASGAIYYSFKHERNVKPCSYQPDMPIIVGSDFNVTPMSWVLGHDYISHGTSRNNNHPQELQIFDEIRINDTNTPATLEYLHRRYSEHTAGWFFYGDAAGRARKTNAAETDYQLILEDDRFAPKRVFYPAANPMLKERFAATNAMLCNARGETRLFIDPGCRYLLDDLKHRSYKENTMEPDDPPMTGHASDATDYWIWAEFPIGWAANFNSMPRAGTF